MRVAEKMPCGARYHIALGPLFHKTFFVSCFSYTEGRHGGMEYNAVPNTPGQSSYFVGLDLSFIIRYLPHLAALGCAYPVLIPVTATVDP